MNITNTLKARGSSHGEFRDNGRIMQQLKDAVRDFKREDGSRGWDYLDASQREALDMILHKIGRIMSGDPNFADHWHDISGYAKLVDDRLQPEKEEPPLQATRVERQERDETQPGSYGRPILCTNCHTIHHEHAPCANLARGWNNHVKDMGL